MAEYVRRELEEESFHVVMAFDIIVLDVMMPFMDGLHVTHNLRRHNVITPLLLLTGRDAPDEIVPGLEAGAGDYLKLNADEHKPWRGKREIVLTRTEFAILECLLRSAGYSPGTYSLTPDTSRFVKVRSRDVGGTGLGLAIAREIARSHGAELWWRAKWASDQPSPFGFRNTRT